MWARLRYQSRDSEIVRGFCVDFGFLVAYGHLVLATLGEAVWSGLVVDSVHCAIDGMVVCAHDDGTVICALHDALFLFCFPLLELDFVDMLRMVEVSPDAGDMIGRSLTRLPVMVIDGDYMEHLPGQNMDMYPAVPNWLMETSQSQNIDI